jgi:hypothetical protein
VEEKYPGEGVISALDHNCSLAPPQDRYVFWVVQTLFSITRRLPNHPEHRGLLCEDTELVSADPKDSDYSPAARRAVIIPRPKARAPSALGWIPST